MRGLPRYLNFKRLIGEREQLKHWLVHVITFKAIYYKMCC